MSRIAFTAKDAKLMMFHKDDVLIGLFGRIYGEIQAAAYQGNIGTIVRVPVELTQTTEFEVRMKQMWKNGFFIYDHDEKDGFCEYEIYWAR